MDSLKKRFWSRVNVKGNSDCWELQGHTVFGYGSIAIGSKSKKTYKQFRAHRLAYIYANGEIHDESLVVMHICDNRKCCNPNHLQLGTQKENMQDMVRKGRSGTYKLRKLTDEDNRYIRHLYYAESRPQREIARFFNVAQRTIAQITSNNFSR